MVFVECLGVSQEDTIKGTQWRETLYRNPGSHDAAGLVGGKCHDNGCRQKSPAPVLYPAQRREGALSATIECSTRHWLDPFARAKFSLLLKKHDPSERALADRAVDRTL